MSDEQLKTIETKIKSRAEALAKEKKKEMEKQLNEIIFQQMQKLRAWSDFVRDFNQTYELQAAEIDTIREEILAERVAISIKKSLNGQEQEQPAGLIRLGE